MSIQSPATGMPRHGQNHEGVGVGFVGLRPKGFGAYWAERADKPTYFVFACFLSLSLTTSALVFGWV